VAFEQDSQNGALLLGRRKTVLLEIFVSSNILQAQPRLASVDTHSQNSKHGPATMGQFPTKKLPSATGLF
jgi:hypothetical protein